jgi:hypothetical protein
MLKLLLPFLLAFMATTVMAQSTAPDNAKLYFISPVDGETVKNPVVVRFGLKNMGVAPAGVQMENAGHHHLLIDTDLPSLNQPVPADEQHLHFGKGQTETKLTLTPGQHTLQLLLGDHLHMPHNPPVFSEKITISVE